MRRMTRMDGLRGVLAVYVMLGHALPFVPAPPWLEALFHHGEAAVDLFFCLSGLVVVQSLERFGFSPGPFLRARARRLLPVYYLVLLFTLGLVVAGTPLPRMGWVTPGSAAAQFWAVGLPPGFFWHLLAHVTLTHGIIPQAVLPWAYITLLGPAWSLSTEWQFYAVAAACRLRNLAALALLLLALAVAYRLAAAELPAYWRFSKAFLPDAAGYFALGVASVSILRAKGARRQEWGVFGLAFAGVLLLGFFSADAWKTLTPVIWIAVLMAQMRPRMLAARMLDWRAVQWLGAISYPLYLLNEPVQRGCAMLAASLAQGDAAVFTAVWFPMAVIMPVLAAALVHRSVEKPMLPKPLLVVKAVKAG